jgi:hypothetical protein
VLGDYPALILPAFDIGTRDIRLQILPMMMLRIPRACGLMKPAKPKHGFGNELEAHLEPLEVAFVGGYIVFTEHSELMFGNAEHHIGVDPRIGVSRVCLPGSMKCLSGDKYFEVAGRMIVLCECGGRPGEAHGRAKQEFSEAEMGHSKGSRRAQARAYYVWPQGLAVEWHCT